MGVSTDVVFTGGGSGGHVFPGLAVAETLNTMFEGRISWIGSRAGIESGIVREYGIDFYGIPAGKLRRYFSLRTVPDVFRIAGGLAASLWILNKIKPKVVFSKGGYVSVPPVIAAKLLRIPVITHESDVDPGLATRINARYADHICVSWEESRAFFDEETGKRVIVTGNPVRNTIYGGNPDTGKDILGIDNSDPVVLVLGGSLGAKQINEMIEQVRDTICKKAWLVHQTGPLHLTGSDNHRYKPYGFIHDELPHILASADVVISRAGANTLRETAALAKPSILIPLSGSGTRGDQMRNARLLFEKGAADVLAGGEATPENLLQKVNTLLESREKRMLMGAAAHSLYDDKAAGSLAELILRYCEA